MEAYYRPGRAGILRLEFEKHNEKTVLVRSYSKLPLQILRPYPFREPDLVYLPLINPTGGIVGGDTFHIHISLRKGARVYLTTQSATKIYRMIKGEESVQQITFEIEEGSELAYHPDKVIPFGGSSFRQTLHVHLDATSRFSMSEILTPGRLFRGEKFSFQRYYSRTEIREENTLVFLDTLDLQPEKENLLEPGCLEGFEYLYTAYFHHEKTLRSSEKPQNLLTYLLQELQRLSAPSFQEENQTEGFQPLLLGSATTTHYGGILVKVLSHSPVLLDEFSRRVRDHLYPVYPA